MLYFVFSGESPSDWIALISEYGVYALFIFFALVLWGYAKRNLNNAKTEELRKYYQKQNSLITWAMLILAGLIVIIWFYQVFIYDQKIMLEGSFNVNSSNLVVDSLSESKIEPNIKPIKSDLRFYSKLTGGLNSDFSIDWVLVMDNPRDSVIFKYEQFYKIKKYNKMIDDSTKIVTIYDNGKLSKHFVLDLTDIDFKKGVPIYITYFPDKDNPHSTLGKIIDLDKPNKEIKWFDFVEDLKIDSDHNINDFFFTSLLAQDEQEKSIFNTKNQKQMILKIADYLGSSDLEKQYLATDILLKNPNDVFYFVEYMINNDIEGNFDIAIMWINVSDILNELEYKNVEINYDLKKSVANKLFDVGAYNQASNDFQAIQKYSDELNRSEILYKPVNLAHVLPARSDGWIPLPIEKYQRLRVYYNMAQSLFYGDGCIQAEFKGINFPSQETRPRYALSLWSDNKQNGYEFYIGYNKNNNLTEYTIYKRLSSGGSKPVTKLNGRWEKDDSINNFIGSINQLKICRKGNQLRFLIGDKEVYSHSDSKVSKYRYFGTDVSAGTKVYIKNLGMCFSGNCN